MKLSLKLETTYVGWPFNVTRDPILFGGSIDNLFNKQPETDTPGDTGTN